ncbi:MAG: decaprenyl-phosphate phosphoribosyltransferase [Anaerolineae bacterium]|nr:decaprenyl-phosphate phosphoribosyltransferase [Anaerolineae bacterium]
MPQLVALFRTMRPKQWTKNVLFVFPAIVADGQVFQYGPLFRVTMACALLCLLAGSVYILNDLVDLQSDRMHPRKRFRPLPAGQLPVPLAQVAAVLIPAFVLVASLILSWKLTVVLTAYFLLQLAYIFRLKHVVLLDIFALTAGFVLRIAAGVVVIEVTNFSPWLYVCLGLLALFLTIAKRRQEYILLGSQAGQVRRIFQFYNLPLLDELLRITTTSTLIAYTVYTIETPSPLLARTNLALATVPFVMYGLFRYLYLMYVKGESAPPDEVLLKDRPLQLDIVLYALSFVVILYVIPR